MNRILTGVLGAIFFLSVLHSAFAEEAADKAQSTSQVVSGAETKSDTAVDDGYQINPEDVLEISVWKEEGLKKDLMVRPDGRISFPLINEVEAAGKTPAQLREEIAKRLEKFIPDPVVSVIVTKAQGNKIYIVGKVARPGEFPAGRYLDVMMALSMAGGLTPFAAENDIKILRKENGKDVVLPFRYSSVKNGENLEQNIRLKGGDTVVVP